VNKLKIYYPQLKVLTFKKINILLTIHVVNIGQIVYLNQSIYNGTKITCQFGQSLEVLLIPKYIDLTTQDDMSFEIKSGADTKACTGEIITYKIKPLLNTLMSWGTSITQCVEGKYFIDEQRFGSDKFWHHWHHFEEVQDGVLMKDILHYALPFGFLGEII
jgi:hypothetical protein